MLKIKMLAISLLMCSAPLMALDLGDVQKQANDLGKNDTVKAVGGAVAPMAADKGAEMLTAKLKDVQNENGPIVFKSGTANLEADKCERTLKAIDGLVKQFPGMLVTVCGYTDNKGSKKANLKMSQKRAQAVIDWLEAHLQTPKSQLAAKGFGSDSPIADNKTEAGRAKNRRVEFVVTRQQ